MNIFEEQPGSRIKRTYNNDAVFIIIQIDEKSIKYNKPAYLCCLDRYYKNNRKYNLRRHFWAQVSKHTFLPDFCEVLLSRELETLNHQSME